MGSFHALQACPPVVLQGLKMWFEATLGVDFLIGQKQMLESPRDLADNFHAHFWKKLISIFFEVVLTISPFITISQLIIFEILR